VLHARQLTRPVAVAKTGVSRFARWVDDEVAMFIQPNLSYPWNHEAGRALCCCGLSSPLATCAAARGHGSVRTKRGVGGHHLSDPFPALPTANRERPCRSALPRLFAWPVPGRTRIPVRRVYLASPTIPWSLATQADMPVG
jgi:hypothetical protein